MRLPTGIWRTITSLFPNRAQTPADSLGAQRRLAGAYHAVFAGDPTREDQELVLADLAKESGFYRVTPARGTTTEELWQVEGKRLLFGHIFSFLNMREADLRELEYAARREAAMDEQFPFQRNT
jgi:hypothetical protein